MSGGGQVCRTLSSCGFLGVHASLDIVRISAVGPSSAGRARPGLWFCLCFRISSGTFQPQSEHEIRVLRSHGTNLCLPPGPRLGTGLASDRRTSRNSRHHQGEFSLVPAIGSNYFLVVLGANAFCLHNYVYVSGSQRWASLVLCLPPSPQAQQKPHSPRRWFICPPGCWGQEKQKVGDSSYRLLEEEQGQGKAGGVGAPCRLSTRVLSKCELGIANKSYRKPLTGHL